MYERLREICKEKNTTITNVCEQVTGNKGNLKTWKKGYMRSDWLSKVADILGVSTDYILKRTEEPVQIMNNNSTINGGIQTQNYNSYEELNGLQKEMIEAMKQLPKSKQLEALQGVYKMIEKENSNGH